MLLDELVVHNFGIYKGRHQVSLTPKASNKPIILFGALNGGGKTTLLDALKLALYGKFANCSNRGSLGYLEFLRRTINHQSAPGEQASIELQFRHHRNGKEDTLRIIRSWEFTGKTLKETSEVLRNEKFDPVITERWYEYVEEFIPAQVSNLFFFDGEKIESLAAEDQSAGLIRTGLHALLGLDLVDRTSNDLRVIETKRKTALANSKEQGEALELQQNISLLQERQTELREQLASEKTNLQNILNKIQNLRGEFRREGGEILEQKDLIEAETREAERQLVNNEIELRELASGAAPLILAQDLLKATQIQAEKETQTQIHKSLKTALIDRDKEILESLKKETVNMEFVGRLESLLSKDRRKRNRRSNREIYLNIPLEAFLAVNDAALNELQANVRRQIKLSIETREHLSELHRKLAAMPSPDALKGVTKPLQKAETKKKEAESRIANLEQGLERLDNQIKADEEKHFQYLENVTEHSFVDATNSRVLNHSERLRNTLETFRDRIAEKHIKQLEKLILESFNHIIQKSDLISRISIEPKSYALTLYTKEGNILPPDRLSAGERQLLSIAILWGLAKASGRPLPTIIDTPLGRLDSNHRNYLVNNYFPFASHQVIIFSTDEEIDEKYYKKLKPFIARQYNIQYRPDISSSEIASGYFEEEVNYVH